MQEQRFTELMSDAFKNPMASIKEVKKKVEPIALRNTKDLSFKNVPDYLRLPDADELIIIRQWAVDYKKQNKNAYRWQPITV